jgi:hypothetical protein
LASEGICRAKSFTGELNFWFAAKAVGKVDLVQTVGRRAAFVGKPADSTATGDSARPVSQLPFSNTGHEENIADRCRLLRPEIVTTPSVEAT